MMDSVARPRRRAPVRAGGVESSNPTTHSTTSASGEAGNAQACAFIERIHAAGADERYGVGIDGNIVTASIKALVSGVNRLEIVGRHALLAEEV